MVYLYLCEACQKGNHKRCELGHPAPPGVYGGSMCSCGCRGNPKWNDPDTIHKELMKQLDDIMKFEEESKLVNLMVGGVNKENLKTKILTGKELRYAAKNELPVFYEEFYYNPQDKHKNYKDVCVMEFIDGYSYYIGNSDINIHDYASKDLVNGEFPEGSFAVFGVKGVKYS